MAPLGGEGEASRGSNQVYMEPPERAHGSVKRRRRAKQGKQSDAHVTS